MGFSPYINRFTQPDSIIPNPANPQSFNRFGYVLNNPIRFNDPTGHVCSDPEAEAANNLVCYGSGTTRVGNRMIRGNGAELGRAKNKYSRSFLTIPTVSDLGTPCDVCNQHTLGDTLRDIMPFTPGDVCRSILSGQLCDFDYTPPTLTSAPTLDLQEDWLNDPEILDHVATITQDLATLSSNLGALVTITSTISGCIAGSPAGVLPGCAAGFGAGIAFHLGVANPFESIMSTVSAAATVRSDYLTGDTDFRSGKIGEDTATAILTWLMGSITSNPFGDAFVDIYSSGYNHGVFCGVSNPYTFDC